MWTYRFFRAAAIAFGFLASLAAFPTPAAGQPSRGAYRDSREMPSGEAGERIRKLLQAINSNDREQAQAFVREAFAPEFREAFPMDEHLDVFAETYARSRGLEFYGIRHYEGGGEKGETVVIVRNKLTDSWQGVILRIEPDPPHRIAGLSFAPARPPSDLPPPKRLSDEELANELKKLIQKLVDAEVFSGTVLVARNGTVIFSGAYGLASREFAVPNKLDTKFNLGSMNKMFTAVAIAQLAQAGKLSLDDPVSKFLSDDWLPREVLDKITVEHLLTHTSGLGSHFTEKLMNSSRELYRKVDDYKGVVAEQKPRFEPGTEWGYSNTGFLLLGAIIEKVSGQSYFDYVREHIYKPAGMTNTDCYEMDRMPPNLAIGYSQVTEGKTSVWVNNLYKHTIRGGPAGGGFSTVEDLLRFDQALRSHKLLNPEMTERLWTPKPNSPEYGYGFGLSGSPGNRIVGHSGGFAGISSDLAMYLDSGYTVAVMSNYDQGSRPIDAKLREWLSAR